MAVPDIRMEITKNPYGLIPSPLAQPQRPVPARPEERRDYAPQDLAEETTGRALSPQVPAAIEQPAEGEGFVDYGELVRRARAEGAARFEGYQPGYQAEPAGYSASRAVAAYVSEAQESYSGAELLPRIDAFI